MVLVFWHLHVSQIYSLSFNEWHWAAKTRELSSLGSGRTTTVIDTKAKRRQPWHYSPLAVDIESPLTGVLSGGLWHQIGHCRLTKIFTGSSTSPPPPQFVSKVKAIFQNWSRPQHSEVKWPFFFLHSSPSILLWHFSGNSQKHLLHISRDSVCPQSSTIHTTTWDINCQL